MEELLLGVHEDVLVACHDLHALSDLPDVGLGGGGDHRHGEVSSFPTMVEFTVSPEGIRPFLPLQVGLMVIASGPAGVARLTMVLGDCWVRTRSGLLSPHHSV